MEFLSEFPAPDVYTLATLAELDIAIFTVGQTAQYKECPRLGKPIELSSPPPSPQCLHLSHFDRLWC